ncbi:FHA domain-containing protein [Scytonema sp. UIC 10036]|uniref:FHA domain-containing protein n=1 Tax=Scytonema sp. UIC 10036 TaxID=2304196 RepID=UPI0012DA1989|nr:FHA domain-containing protein [Scytonema sp. UIC 10036]MUG96836.1 FHA domain-containing protein [Scytonema sp. UIC 10036]
MAVQNQFKACLKQISPPITGQAQYQILPNQVTVIGREPNCQIVLNSAHYQGVSRRHAEIRPLGSNCANGLPLFQICDLGSANGTYVNGQLLQGCHSLQVGDRIKLGQHGPEFIFECQSAYGVMPLPDPQLAPPTVYEYGSSPPPTYPTAVPPPSQPNSILWKTLAGIAAGIAVIYLINNYRPTPQITSRPTTASSGQTQEPAPATTSTQENSGVIVKGAEVFDRYFNVGDPKRHEDVTITNKSSGEEHQADILVSDVEAKGNFSTSEVKFVVHFYDAQGNQVANPKGLHYKPDPQQWTAGTKSTVWFELPPRNVRSQVKVMSFER